MDKDGSLKLLKEFAESKRDYEAKKGELRSREEELAEARQRDDNDDLIRDLESKIGRIKSQLEILNEECRRLREAFESTPIKATKIGENS